MSRWRTLHFHFHAMACPCSLQMDGMDESHMRHAATEAIAEIHRIEQKFSRYRHDSVISLINRSAGKGVVEVDTETAYLLDFSEKLWQLSDGLFDVTSGVLRRAWDFKNARLPDPENVKHLLTQVGWQHVEHDANQVRLEKAGMELDFGGFGKEYAADLAAVVLQSHGVNHALVNLGGDLHATGGRGLPEMEGAPWQIEIQHPRQDSIKIDGNVSSFASLAALPLGRGGLATSGDYERFFIHDGQRYCHVLNPQTGWPVSHWQSVSILAANTTSAGALSTIALLKEADAPAWLEAQGVRYLMVQKNGEIQRNQTA